MATSTHPTGPVDDWNAYDLARFWEHVVTKAPLVLQFGDGNGSLSRRRRPVPLLQIVKLARDAEAGRFANDRDPSPNRPAGGRGSDGERSE